MKVLGRGINAWRLQSKESNVKIIASDLSKKALYAAQSNARTAGVEDLIEFVQCDFRETPVPQEVGTKLLNPEYGERLGEEKELESVYQAIGFL